MALCVLFLGCSRRLPQYIPMKKIAFFLLLLLTTAFVFGQNVKYARKTIDKLCSKKFHGRGYVNGGDAKAAAFIYKELKKLKGVEVQYQPFSFSVNTFPSKMKVEVDGEELLAGVDYLADPSSPSIKGTYPLLWIDYRHLQNPVLFDSIISASQAAVQVVGVIDTLPTLNPAEQNRLKKLLYTQNGNLKGIIQLTNKKLLWSVAGEQNQVPLLHVAASKLPRTTAVVKLDIHAELKPNHVAQNVIGFIKGTKQPDSIIALTAHYDHLGQMGKSTYFPGANDNASGTAMLLDMAKHYSQTPPQYSILFIAFAAEEAGLIGSNYYVNAQPVYPLEKMKFLINMDLMATGEKGIMAVNGLVFENEYKALVKINDDKKYLSTVQARGKAANSDHYWFAEKGVHCFFFYLMGDFPSYHDPGDKAEIVPLTEYEDTFRLITDFVEKLQQ